MTRARIARVSWLRFALAWLRSWRRMKPLALPEAPDTYSCGCLILLTGPIVHADTCPRTRARAATVRDLERPPSVTWRHAAMDYPIGDPRRPRS